MIHLTLFVGDALAGNDAVDQARTFQEILKFDNIKVYNTQKIDLSNYPQGFYHLSIFEDEKKLNSYKLNLIK